MSFMEPIVKAVFESKGGLSTKAAIVVLIIFLLVLVDGIFGYSYFYHSNKKIEQVAKINALIQDTTLNPEVRNEAVRLQKELMGTKRLSEELVPFLSNINIGRSLDPVLTKAGNKRSVFWYHATAGGIFFFLALIYIPRVLFGGNVNILTDFATAIFYTALSLAIGFFLSWLFTFIPPIAAKTWFWNYALNLVLQIIIFGVGTNFLDELD